MSKDRDTLLATLCVFIDDHVVPPRTGRGRRPELTDSELICLAAAQVLLRFDGERRWIRHIHSESHLERHAGRTPAGVFTRVAQRLLAMAAGI